MTQNCPWSLTITPVLFAQQQGNVVLGGVAGINFSSGKDRSSLGTWLNPKVARYFRDNSALGLGFAYSFYHSADGGFESTNHSLFVYPFFRKVVPHDDDKGVCIEIGPTMGFDYRKSIYQGSASTVKSVFAGAWARPGLYYFVTDRFAAECMIGVLEYRLTAEIQDDRLVNPLHSVNASFGLSSLSIGLLYYFGRDEK
jgi:hypothetical protein